MSTSRKDNTLPGLLSPSPTATHCSSRNGAYTTGPPVMKSPGKMVSGGRGSTRTSRPADHVAM